MSNLIGAISLEAEDMMRLERKRENINLSLSGSNLPLLAIIGPCTPLLKDEVIIAEEGRGINTLSTTINGQESVHRLPIWKPRSDPNAYDGEESANPEGSKVLLKRQTKAHANVAIEFGNRVHVNKYAKHMAFAWIGARSVNDVPLQHYAAAHDTKLPLGIKNGLTGEVEPALRIVDGLRKLRGPSGAEVTLIYRGGENAKTPKQWEDQYKRALDLTNGRLIVDTAHGGEMAHDPSGRFTKSVVGQIACLNHVTELVNQGHVPAGIMVEASSAESPVDPVIPIKTAIKGVIDLNLAIRKGEYSV